MTFYNENIRAENSLRLSGELVQVQPNNVVYVTKNPVEGQFSSIKAAVDSITGAASTNHYVVNISPGIYIEDTIVMKPFVVVQGLGYAFEDVIINPTSPNQDIIHGAAFSAIAGVSLEGATGTGQAAVRYTSGDPTPTTFRVWGVTFGDNDTLVHSESVNNYTSVDCREISFSSNINFNKGFVCLSGGATAVINLFNLVTFVPGLVNDILDVQGNQANIVFTESYITNSPAQTSNHFAKVRDGGNLEVRACNLLNFNTCVFSENMGVAPSVNILDTFMKSSNLDLKIEHPGTSGFFTGVADRGKIQINPDSTFIANYTDIFGDTKGNLLTGQLFQGADHNNLVNISEALHHGTSVGVNHGGGLTFDPGTFNLNVEAGDGYVSDQSQARNHLVRVEWEATVLVMPSFSEMYATVDHNGVVQLESSIPEKLSGRIILGFIISGAGAIVTAIESHVRMENLPNLLERYIRDCLGAIYVSGSLVSESSITDRAIDVTSGKYYFGSKSFAPDGGDQVQFSTVYRDGSGGFNANQNQTVVPNNIYDDGSGVLASVPTGEYVKHTLIGGGDGSNEVYALVLGQNTFSVLNDAVNAGLPMLPPGVKDGRIIIAEIITQEGNPNFAQNPIDVRPKIGGVNPVARSVTSHNDLSDLADDDHPLYLRADGQRSMTGSLDMDSNQINNVTTINNVDITNHASRHLPNGGDPLATAPASTLSADTVNTTGINNSLSQSDHTHEILTATGINISGNTNTEGGSSALAKADHTHEISQNPPSQGQYLRWDGANWNPATINNQNISIGYAEAEAEQATTNTTSYTEALNLTVNIPETGDYLVEWSWEARSDQNDRVIELRVQIDDTQEVMHHIHGEQSDRLTPLPYFGGSGFKRVNLAVGSRSIDFDFAPRSAPGRVRRVRLMITKVD